MGGQNFLLQPDELELSSTGHLVFYVENQRVYEWATRPSGNDPPVWIRMSALRAEWEEQSSCLSQFLIEIALLEAMFAAPYGASCDTPDSDTHNALLDGFTAIPGSPWRWPTFPHRIYLRGDVILFAGPTHDDNISTPYSFIFGSRRSSSLDFCAEVHGVLWHYTNFPGGGDFDTGEDLRI
jgi:hypothetical protein